MKLPLIISAFTLAGLLTSCTSETTEYNGFVKNSTESSINVTIKGINLLLDSLSIPSGATTKVYFENEEGVFEIFDCSSFFDTIYYTSESQTYTLVSDTATIASTSETGSDGTRVHECTVELR